MDKLSQVLQVAGAFYLAFSALALVLPSSWRFTIILKVLVADLGKALANFKSVPPTALMVIISSVLATYISGCACTTAEQKAALQCNVQQDLLDCSKVAGIDSTSEAYGFALCMLSGGAACTSTLLPDAVNLGATVLACVVQDIENQYGDASAVAMSEPLRVPGIDPAVVKRNAENWKARYLPAGLIVKAVHR